MRGVIINVRSDESLVIDSIILPSDESHAASFGSINHLSVIEGNSVSVSMSKTYSKYHIDTVDFEEFKDFKSKLKSISNSYIKLITSPLRESAR